MRTRLLSLSSLILAMVLLATGCAATPELTLREPVLTFEEVLAEEVAFAASPEFLGQARKRSEAAESMRYEVYTHIDSSFISMGSQTTPMITGEASGVRSRWNIDMSPLLGLVAPELNDSALRMSVVADGDQIYLNAPVFAELGRAFPSEVPDDQKLLSLMDTLDTGWGRIDGSEFFGSDLMTEFNANSNALQMLDLLEATGATIEGAPVEVRGVPTRVVHANVSWYDLFVLSGQSPEALGLSAEDADALRDFTTDIAVHVDDEALVRRLEYTMDIGQLAQLDPSIEGIDLSLWQRVDYFDFGAPVNIELPQGAIDVTDDFDKLAELAG